LPQRVVIQQLRFSIPEMVDRLITRFEVAKAVAGRLRLGQKDTSGQGSQPGSSK
jgi:hypothetical protein